MLQMEEGQRLLCESLILEALNKGLRGQMTCATHICDLTHSPPPGPTPPPATSPTPEPQLGRKRGKKTRK
ncbi:hypothetical protein AB205_0003370 [Aquarana catesbeiana]|uniref:Uncharacterized protein n=1 Tax=Aquarana catesbeiana TaxID=8400 RepID=A0A2G9Q4F8_AQUCT|nr:hypothetical protein AB205_0003370 [Aquarana catesbeiana]